VRHEVVAALGRLQAQVEQELHRPLLGRDVAADAARAFLQVAESTSNKTKGRYLFQPEK